LANPAGPNAGWQLYLHYAFDQAKTRDIFELGGPTRLGNTRSKNDPGAVSVFWKQNSLVSFVLEESMYRTRIADPNLTYIARSPQYQGVGAPSGARFWVGIRAHILSASGFGNILLNAVFPVVGFAGASPVHQRPRAARSPGALHQGRSFYAAASQSADAARIEFEPAGRRDCESPSFSVRQSSRWRILAFSVFRWDLLAHHGNAVEPGAGGGEQLQ